MHITHKINILITEGIIFLLIIGFFIPSSTSIEIDPDDGIWKDSFENQLYFQKNANCYWEPGTISLKREGSEKTYNFLQSDHEAYFFKEFSFLLQTMFVSPTNLINIRYPDKNSLIPPEIELIEEKDNDYFRQSLSLQDGYFKNYITFHYRFHVNIDIDTVDKIKFEWYGKVNTTARIRFYYWRSSDLIGNWQNIGKNFSVGSNDIFFNKTLTENIGYTIEDNYIDFLVVAYFPIPSLTDRTLSADYVEITAGTEEGYTLNKGEVTSHKIDPISISDNIDTFYWELLSWDDSQPGDTEVRYQLLYETDANNWIEVENTTLPGNKQGFTTSPVYLNNLDNTYGKLKIRATLSTESPSVSPRIFSWTLTWQNGSRWQDTFNSSYRIDKRLKANIENGTITISSVQDEWPLFGFDSSNTRASNGKGPTTNFSYWYAANPNQEFQNPIIADGKVYIFSKRSLYVYNVTIPAGSTEDYKQEEVLSIPFDYDLDNSPAISDKYIIIATGEQAPKGTVNYIYAYKKENLSSLQWDYLSDEKICYTASPVISNNVVLISTWGGDNRILVPEKYKYKNNKLIALNLDTGEYLWDYPLDAASFSTPAVSSDIVVVACDSPDNDSIIALRFNEQMREKIWSKQIGAVGSASPVIYENTVFVTCKQVNRNQITTKIIAYNLDDGTHLWNSTLSELPSNYKHFADSTPCVYDHTLYAVSPDGKVHALFTSNGTEKWSPISLPVDSTDGLFFSPAYADNHVYIGTPAPNGKMYAINVANGKISWSFSTWRNTISGSPVVTNGLVFFTGNTENLKYLYSVGKFIASTTEVTGSITSIPIRLQEGYWWGKFYADVTYNSSISNIKFTLLDENENILKNDIKNRSTLTLIGPTLGRAIRLKADFSAKNLSKNNPKLSRWYITLVRDTIKPFLDSSTFTPDPNGWLSEIVPSFSIKTQDNTTGLQVKSAQYSLEYTINNISQSSTHMASCTGENGTTTIQTITMNISSLPFFDEITSLKSIRFSISDLAANTASKTVTFKQDIKKPTSRIKPLLKNRYNSTYIIINATANDTGTLNIDASGIKLVELFYRYSESSNFSGDWILFGSSKKLASSWNFNFSDNLNQPGGYFELCTIATDNAGHIEDFPSSGDVSFLYDWKKPGPPNVWGETLWFKERPRFSVVFEDDYRLNTILYRPNFIYSWTTLASNINTSVYNTGNFGNSWILKEEYWDQMIEGQVYYLYFKINDTLGNTRLITSSSQAIVIRKDTSIPNITIDHPSSESEWISTDNFTVSGVTNDQNGSGLKEVLLYYRYSTDKSEWSNWTQYGDILYISPFKWEFNATEGDGFYQFKINVSDKADNSVESEVFTLSVVSFPVTLAIVLLGLVIVLLLVSSIIFIKWRKRK